MVEARFRWTFPEAVALPAGLAGAAERAGVSPRLAGLLARRGVRTAGDLAAWFGEPLDGLHDPGLLPDAGRLLDRVRRARDARESVQVFGDFDADGLTGLAILTIALRRFGVDAVPYVPSRLDEGHGLSLAAVDAAEARGVSLIVTVDCGSTSHAEIAAANRRGLDVIVTDHHRVPEVMPPAYALVNPHRADATYPDRRLAGSGVAFKIAQLLLADLPGGPGAALELADLATIGTVADVSPIVGENRAIARIGLERIRRDPRPGVAALLERARIAPSAVDLETIAFALAPRLNAAGRMGEALEAARLLLAEEPVEAILHADALEAANLARRDLTRTVVAEARAMVATAPGAPAIVVNGPWSVGIVGLVAARLVEDGGRPAVVGAELGDVIRASCRSDGSLDLGAALEQCGDLFLRHGGHAGAAGFELPADRWDAFRERFLALAAAAAPPDPRVAIAIDLALPAKEVDYGLYRELSRLAPCGPGNADACVAVLGMTVTRVRAANGGHSQLTLRRELDVLDGIAFGRPDIAEVVHEGDRLDVVARLTSRTFGGFESLQLDIRDVATAGSHPETAAILDPVPSVAVAGGTR
ncbi:MAG: single-stranded-DNA-specific exonuclease RecJ [Chloroflexi bacterium]|nr:single-stranded-DNA-specific exonuclease RecJ [Chloroflexota bacterium]